MIMHCCERMVEELAKTCERHPDRADCPDALVEYWPDRGLYGLLIHDGGSSMILIDYCPWCGRRIAPNSN